MIKGLTNVWSRTVGATSQSAANSRAIRELLRMVVYVSLLAIAYTLYETISLIKLGKIDAITGTLLGGVFTLFGGVLSVAIPAFISALKAEDNTNKTVTIPPQGGTE